MPGAQARGPQDSIRRETALAAFRAALETDPRASVGRLAAAAGISRAGFYRLFPSREAALAALDLQADPDARERVLAAALDLLGSAGLSHLSMEDVAAAAGVSRSTLYRLCPGKAALFRDLFRRYAPFAAVNEALDAWGASPPEVALPQVAAAVARAVSHRMGIIRTLFLEMTSGAADTSEAGAYVMEGPLGRLGGYIAAHMAQGRLRPMPPLLALQGFIGPLILHNLTRAMMERQRAIDLTAEEAAVALARAWVAGMLQPPGSG